MVSDNSSGRKTLTSRRGSPRWSRWPSAMRSPAHVLSTSTRPISPGRERRAGKGGSRHRDGGEPPSESYLLSGRRRDRSEDIEELRKLGTTAAIEGHVAFLLDNVPTGWGSAHPSSTLSQPRPSTVGVNSGRTKPRPVRHLPSGFSQGTISAPLATPSGGRSPSGYTAAEEQPDEREYTGPEVMTQRDGSKESYSRCCLIASAYIQAGRPDVQVKPFGSFENGRGLRAPHSSGADSRTRA